MRRCFKLGSTATKFDLRDVLKKEFREYQTYKAKERKGEQKENKKSRKACNIRIGSMLMYGLLDISRQQIN